jgi:hypothetical protein
MSTKIQSVETNPFEFLIGGEVMKSLFPQNNTIAGKLAVSKGSFPCLNGSSLHDKNSLDQSLEQ